RYRTYQGARERMDARRARGRSPRMGGNKKAELQLGLPKLVPRTRRKEAPGCSRAHGCAKSYRYRTYQGARERMDARRARGRSPRMGGNKKAELQLGLPKLVPRRGLEPPRPCGH